MKHHVIKNRDNLSTFEIFIFGSSFILGMGVSIIFGLYSILRLDIIGILIFVVIFLFSLWVFFYVQDKTKGIEV